MWAVEKLVEGMVPCLMLAAGNEVVQCSVLVVGDRASLRNVDLDKAADMSSMAVAACLMGIDMQVLRLMVVETA